MYVRDKRDGRERRRDTHKCGSSNGDRPSASTAQTIACVRSFVRSRRYLLCACSPLKDPTSWVPPTDSLGVIFHTGNQGGVGRFFFFRARGMRARNCLFLGIAKNKEKLKIKSTAKIQCFLEIFNRAGNFDLSLRKILRFLYMVQNSLPKNIEGQF